jgi:hypothetical protein
MARGRKFRAGDCGSDICALCEVKCRVDCGVGTLREADEKDALERPRVTARRRGPTQHGEQRVKRWTRNRLEAGQATALGASRLNHCAGK